MAHSNTSLAVLLLVCFAVVDVPTSWAQPAPTFRSAKKLFDDGVFLYETRDYKEALKIFLSSQQLNARSTTVLYIARCYLKLKRKKLALRYYRQYIPAYSSEPRKQSHPPDVIREVREQIRILEASTRVAKTKPSPKQEPPKKRKTASNLWFIVGITSVVLSLGFETMAWISYAKAEQHYEADPEFATYSNATVAGHVLAATFAVAAATSFFWYYKERKRSEEPPVVGFTVFPASSGFSVVGRFTF